MLHRAFPPDRGPLGDSLAVELPALDRTALVRIQVPQPGSVFSWQWLGNLVFGPVGAEQSPSDVLAHVAERLAVDLPVNPSHRFGVRLGVIGDLVHRPALGEPRDAGVLEDVRRDPGRQARRLSYLAEADLDVLDRLAAPLDDV